MKCSHCGFEFKLVYDREQCLKEAYAFCSVMCPVCRQEIKEVPSAMRLISAKKCTVVTLE